MQPSCYAHEVKQMSNANYVPRLHVGIVNIQYTSSQKILQYAMSRDSVHQSAALNCMRGEYHHVMHCIQAED